MSDTTTDQDPDSNPENFVEDDYGDRTWHDISYKCHDCGESHKSVSYVLRWLSASVVDWDQDEFDKIKHSVVYQFNRSRYYPNDFNPTPLPCPNCAEDLEPYDYRKDQEGYNTSVEKVEKDEERSDYVSHLARLCPTAWEEDVA